MANIYDVDLEGTIDSSGIITQYYNKEAIANSIRLWLTSFSNDFIRSPGSGGYVTKYLFKAMTDENRRNIYASIYDGFQQDYSPKAVLKELRVDPDYENKRWVINIVVYIDAIKSDVPVVAELNSLV